MKAQNGFLSNTTFLVQSLKSRGIRFPGRDNESLAPIFTPPHSAITPEADVSFADLIQYDIHGQSLTSVTPPRSATTPEADVSLAHLMPQDIHMQSFKSEQIKETFDVARNSIELLSTVLSSTMQQNVLKVIYFLSSCICMFLFGCSHLS